jgi:hypothetical protein
MLSVINNLFVATGTQPEFGAYWSLLTVEPALREENHFLLNLILRCHFKSTI